MVPRAINFNFSWFGETLQLKHFLCTATMKSIFRSESNDTVYLGRRTQKTSYTNKHFYEPYTNKEKKYRHK